MYVMKTLDILDEVSVREGLSEEDKELIATTLKWSEVAKGGLARAPPGNLLCVWLWVC